MDLANTLPALLESRLLEEERAIVLFDWDVLDAQVTRLMSAFGGSRCHSHKPALRVADGNYGAREESVADITGRCTSADSSPSFPIAKRTPFFSSNPDPTPFSSTSLPSASSSTSTTSTTSSTSSTSSTPSSSTTTTTTTITTTTTDITTTTTSSSTATPSCSLQFVHCFAVKACPVAGVLIRLKENGMGAEVASRVELELALRLGFSPHKIVYDSPCKRPDDLRYALLEAGQGQGVYLNVDNFQEIDAIAKILQLEENHSRYRGPGRLSPPPL